MARDTESMTAKEVAARHGVDVTTVYRWIQSGQLPARRLAGRRYVVARVDCEALLVPVEPGAPVATRHQRGREVEQAIGELRARGLEV